MSGYTNVLMRATSLDTAPKFDAFTGVRIWCDDETAYFAGDETGRVLEADCPWATQAMADEILATVSGFAYQPFNARGALLAPIAELGDGVNVGGVYSTLGVIGTDFDALCAAGIGAPADEEIDHEYPYMTKQEREMLRKVSLGKSYYGTKITKANGLEVVKTEADGTEKSRVKLNSDVLAFYNDDGEEALYFDAAAGKYRFRGDVEVTGGSMNISDNFIVDARGNVQMNGSVTIAGSLTMTGESNWVQVRYSTNSEAVVPVGWSKEWDSTWSNADTQVWAIYSYNGGSTWTQPMMVQGKTGEQGPAGEDGQDGSDGSDANVPAWVEAYTDSAEFNTLVSNEWVVAMNLYGSKIYGGEFYGNEFNVDSEDSSGSFNLYGRFNNVSYHFFEISYWEGEAPYVRLDSPAGGFIRLGGNSLLLLVDSKTIFYDEVDFSNATVTGLDIVFG